MANEKRIIVEIKVSGSTNDEKKQPGDPNETKNKNKQKTKEEASKAIATMALENVASLVINSAGVSMSRYFSMSENYMAETDFQNAITMINKGKSFASTIFLSSKAAGLAAGPYGAALGAIIGAATWVGSEYINYQQKMSNYYQNLNATNYQTEFDRTRLGLTNEGKGTEN